MKLYREQGVVLRTYKLGEADRIVVLLTPGAGKVRAVAKGVRRTKSRFGGRLEPFTQVDCSLYRGRTLDTITQVEVLDAFAGIRADYDLVCAGSTILEAVDHLAQECVSGPRLYLLVLRALRALNAAPASPSLLLAAFLLKLMSLEGYAPELLVCVTCASPGPHTRLSVIAGGALCAACATGAEVVLTAETIPLMLSLLEHDLVGAGSAQVPVRTAREAEGLSRTYAEHHLDRQLRAHALVVGA